MSEYDSEEDFGPSPPDVWCARQARCRACQFGLVNRELIHFALGSSAHGVSCVFEYRESIEEERYIDPSVDFEAHVHFPRSEPKYLCGEHSSFCLHSHCRSRLPSNLSSRRSFFAITDHGYTPSKADEERRRHRLQVACAKTLCESSLGPSLPPEIWHMIAADMTRDYAVILAQEHESTTPRMRDHGIDLRQPVYASYVKFEGIVYLREMGNKSPHKTAGTRTLRLSPGVLGSAEMDMYIAQDHLGIRQAVFITPEKRDAWCRAQTLVPGVWWRRIPLGGTEGTVHLVIQSDTLKVREIQDHSEATYGDYLSNMLWRAPLPSPPDLLDLMTLAAPIKYPHGHRMMFFECNRSDAIGYLVACTDDGVFDIVAHKRNDKTVPNLLEGTRLLHWPPWKYMPVDEDEHVTHISTQVRPRNHYRDVCGNLMFTTNKGRNTVFGGIFAATPELVFAVPRDESRVYFSCWDTLYSSPPVQYMALESTSQPDPSPSLEAPKLPTPLGIPDSRRTHLSWAYTACSLDGVSEILPCTDRTNCKIYTPVIGILVSYTNGHRECVGQFRPDWVVEPISLLGKNTLFLQHIKSSPETSSIIGVKACAPCETDGAGWTAVPLAGVLEWWHALRYSILFLDGNEIEVPENAAKTNFYV